MNAQLASQKMKMGRIKCLGENINRLGVTSDISRNNKTILEGITNKIKINLGVLRALMKNGISGNINCRLIVAMEKNQPRDKNI